MDLMGSMCISALAQESSKLIDLEPKLIAVDDILQCFLLLARRRRRPAAEEEYTVLNRRRLTKITFFSYGTLPLATFCVAQASQCVLACELRQDRVRRAVRQVGAVAEGDDKQAAPLG